ncbi:MAG: sialate O-acetylesterase [Bacteroidales bacterium]|nr:sialate O-acetylesterase [Bacteroidales bacterium]
MKKNLIFSIITAAVAATIGTQAQAKVTLPDIISDNMVLQQSTSANLWGKAAPNSEVTVTVSWSDRTYGCTADSEGRWIVKVDTPAASYEPQSLTISDGEDSVTLSNILIGEVWFCSGQSNMEMPLDGFRDCPVEHSAEIIATSGKWKGIRVATVPKTPALEPQEETPGKWKVSSPENAPEFSATGYTFAMMLNSVLDIPVGIINCSWGGASVEGWSPRELLDTYPDIDVDATFKDFEIPEYGWQWSYTFPMIMYNGMLHPLRNYTIKGFLWYQGCANVGAHETYPDRLNNMVTWWRNLWQEGDIPFYIVEIAPWNYGGDGLQGARFRECQMKASQLITNSGIVCTNDLVYPYEADQIHPCRKQEVGNRLAYLALNKTYGYDNLTCQGPQYKDMTIENGRAIITFYNDEQGFSPWHDAAGFEIAGEDRVFRPAHAEVINWEQKVVVWSDEVPDPVAVRYCFKDFQIGGLTGGRNLPAFPFRTDDWE